MMPGCDVRDVKKFAKDERFPLARFFLVFERVLKDLPTPGGRILILSILVLVGYLTRGHRELGSAAFIALLWVLARHPTSPSVLEAILAFILNRSQRGS